MSALLFFVMFLEWLWEKATRRLASLLFLLCLFVAILP